MNFLLNAVSFLYKRTFDGRIRNKFLYLENKKYYITVNCERFLSINIQNLKEKCFTCNLKLKYFSIISTICAWLRGKKNNNLHKSSKRP